MEVLGTLSPTTILDAATGTGAGSAYRVPQVRPSRGGPPRFAWEIRLTGTPTTVQVDLEGSLDGINWYQIGTSNATSDSMNWVTDKPTLFVRANVVTLTGGSSPTVTVVAHVA